MHHENWWNTTRDTPFTSTESFIPIQDVEVTSQPFHRDQKSVSLVCLYSIFGHNSIPPCSGGSSHFVDGGTDYEFKIKQAVITPRTEALAGQLNAAPKGTCGLRGRWAANASQDVTPTGGCQGMGLRIPLLEHDLGWLKVLLEFI